MGENNFETHDLLIGAVIVIILLVQFAVFFTAWKKIKLFKRIIPEEHSFKMVKVHIPETLIKELSVNGILENEERYSQATSGDQQAYLELEQEMQSVEEEENNADDWDEEEVDDSEEHPETEIWISKDNEEKKIQYQFLKSHETSGWVRIDY